MKHCKLYLNYAGFCQAKASHAVKGDPHKDIRFRALFGLIEHPNLGWILFDTGYAKRFYDATKSFPNKIYALITKVTIVENDEIKKQLIDAEISPNDIKHIIISHFHADHIAGLKDFKNAQFYCSKLAWTQVVNIPAFWGFAKGILKSLIPDTFLQRVLFIEDVSKEIDDEIFGKVYDIFSDDSILAFNVPGHAAGQIGVKLQTNKQTYLLVADACWDIRAITDLAFPHPIVRLFFDSWKDFKQSIFKLKKYHKKYPNHIIVPTHCHRTTEKLVSKKLNIDEL